MTDMNVYVILTHTFNSFVKRNIQHMIEDLGFQNIILCYDNTNGSFDIHDAPNFQWKVHELKPGDPLPELHSGGSILLFHHDVCMHYNPLHSKCRDNYDTFIGVLHHVLKFDYQYLWFIENDVACHGSWKRTLDQCSAMNQDFLATRIGSYEDSFVDKTWPGWHALHHYQTVPLHRRWKAFVPISRYSKPFVKTLSDGLGVTSGWIEVYLATLCRERNYTLADFPHSMISDHWTWFGISSDQWRDIRQSTKPADKLYHPVKGHV